MNTRKDKQEKIAEKAIRALQKELLMSSLTEVEAMIILRIITTKLEKALDSYVTNINDPEIH